MKGSKADIINRLQKEILPLQGYKPLRSNELRNTGLGPILNAFPGRQFPFGTIQEFIIENRENAAATSGFITGIAGTLMEQKGALLWISRARNIYPPALGHFNIDAANIIFIEIKKDNDILWATEEALRCEALSAVVSEVPDLSFTASRRLQLAVEISRVTGFVIRKQPKNINTTASFCRWKITPVAGELPGDVPGVGFPRWNVELLKVRNGQPGTWIVSWKDGRFQHEYRQASMYPVAKQKTG